MTDPQNPVSGFSSVPSDSDFEHRGKTTPDDRESIFTPNGADSLAVEAAAPLARPQNWQEALDSVAGHFQTIDKFRRIRSDMGVAARCISDSVSTRGASIGAELRDMPCDPIALRPLLKKVMPARYWAGKGRWSSICSSVSMVLRLCGWVQTERGSKVTLPDAWANLVEKVAHPTQVAILRSFARFCLRQGTLPSSVCETTVEEYRNHRTRSSMDLDVDGRINTLRRVWNHVQSSGCATEINRLAQRPRPNSYVLPDEQLPAVLMANIELFLERLARPGPLDETVRRKRARSTLGTLRGILKRSASLLLRAGWHADTMVSVADLVRPEALEVILMDQWDRIGKCDHWPAGSVTLASYFKMIIMNHNKSLSENEKQISIGFCKRVTPGRFGMNQKTRDKIRRFDDPVVMDAWKSLAPKCFEAADAFFKEGKRKVCAARLSQAALAVAILQCKPLRRANLATLDLARHFEFDKKGRPVAFCIDGRETKTGLDAEAILPDWLASRMKLHIEKYRPLLAKQESTFLFPGKIEGHIHLQSISNMIRKLIETHLGLAVNVHLTRHIVATIIMDDDPNNGPIAQRMLDHSDLKTTTRYYGMVRGRSAQKLYAQILESKSALPSDKKVKSNHRSKIKHNKKQQNQY